MELQQGFVLTRHWRDTDAGTEVEFWLATDHGPRRVRLQPQISTAFIPEQHRERDSSVGMILPTDRLPGVHDPSLTLYAQRQELPVSIQHACKHDAAC